jgi:hypothetical protein
MRRKLNFTSRAKIPKSRVQIALRREAKLLAFDGSVDLSGLSFPRDAKVIVEAYYRTSLMRFDWGTAGQLTAPNERRLTEIDSDRVVHFRVKVVASDASGRILGLADDLMVAEKGGGEDEMSLLPVNFVELGELPWRVDYSGAGTTLEINRSIEGAEGLVRNDPKTAALLFPAAAREILTRIILVDEHELEEESDEWWNLWLRWASTIAPDAMPESGDPGEKLAWIEEVVKTFSARHEFATRFHQTPEEAVET